MPLFHDPDRWGHRHWSGDQSELEQPAPESPQPRSAQASEFRSPVTESRETVAEVPPTESCLSQVRSYDRQDLIHRIKEASHWRSQRQVCEAGPELVKLYLLASIMKSAHRVSSTRERKLTCNKGTAP